MLLRKIISGPKIEKGVELRHCFCCETQPKVLINHKRDIPEKPSMQSYREVLSFCYALKENSDSKVIIDYFWKSYL